MIGRRFIGLSLCERGLRAVAVGKRRRQTQILGWEERPWPAPCLKPDFREGNIIDEETFCATVRETLKALGIRKGTVALSLSDAVGRILVTTIEEPLKRGREGINLLKWQLRDQLLLDPEEIRLSYQVIDREPEGRTRVLIAASSNGVLEQYEKLLAAVGANPAMVLFDSLNLMNFYQARGLSAGDHLLVNRTPATLTLLLFREGRLQACRSRRAPDTEKRLFQEVVRTLADWERTWPEAGTAPVYLHGSTAPDSCREALEGALGRPAQTPSVQPPQLAPGLKEGPKHAPDLFGAIGGAERLFGVLP